MKIPTKPKNTNKYKKKVAFDSDSAQTVINTLSHGIAAPAIVAGGYYAGKAIKGTIKGFKSIGKTMGRKP